MKKPLLYAIPIITLSAVVGLAWAQTGAHRDAKMDDEKLSDLSRAYQNLHGQARDALMAHAKRSGEGQSATALDLDGEGLLIAACSKGLICGAPTASDRAQPKDDSGSEGGTNDRRRGDGFRDQNPDSGQRSKERGTQSKKDRTVGVLLVCECDASLQGASSGERSGRTTGATGRDESGLAPSTGKTARVSQGFYVVELWGNSYMLTDPTGRVVLTGTLEGHPSSRSSTPKSGKNDGDGESMREREEPMSAESKSWPVVFAAVSKKLMMSNGWSDPSVASGSR